MLPARIPARIKIERILCPTDYSDFSKRALAQAVRLARWFEASVTVIHVLSPSTWVVTPDAMVNVDVQADFMEAWRQREAEVLEHFVEPHRGQGVAIHTQLLDGDASRLIQEAALELPADVVVMGTHGRSGFEHLLLGSVTQKVLHRAVCPVLTVGRRSTSEPDSPLFRRLLCAVDMTRRSTRTLDMALSLAEENMGAVAVLHVLEGVPGPAVPARHRASPEAARIRAEIFEEAQDQLRRSVPPEARAFCSVTERVEEGTPWREILKVAESRDAEVIVIGAHSSSLLDRAFFGSTVDRVVREARCPVLVVRETVRRKVLEEAALDAWSDAGTRAGAPASATEVFA